MRTGFSLVELSIVLVILGLLVGGVLTGQSLIRAAELRSVTTEFQKYQAAVNTFRDKYFAIPGDMANATSFWGAAHATPATCLTTVGTGTQTCNGDGDGVIETVAAASQRGEPFMFWQHLANAGLVEGSYSGMAGTASADDYEIGVNAPRAKISSNGWLMVNGGNHPGSAMSYKLEHGHFFETGGIQTDSYPYLPAFAPQEAWNIDKKMDDGKPASGSIIARYWNNLCAGADDGTSAFDDYAASYRLSDGAKQCTITFIKAF